MDTDLILKIFSSCIETNTLVTIHYRDSDNVLTSRKVEPISIHNNKTLKCWCRKRGSWRSFNADKVEDIKITGKKFRPVVQG